MTKNPFIENVRRALGKDANRTLMPDNATHLSTDGNAVEARMQAIERDIQANAEELITQLQESASQAGWKVIRVSSAKGVEGYVKDLARDLEARTILGSTHPVLDSIDIEASLQGTGIQYGVMAIDDDPEEAQRDQQRQDLRQQAIHADIGVTGVDYAIAETGSAVLLAKKGVSRVVSLLPPVHVAIVEKGQILPSLDELFTLRRNDFLTGGLGSYMNLITGPSRSADIEYTLVTGVHGPGEVHMIIVG